MRAVWIGSALAAGLIVSLAGQTTVPTTLAWTLDPNHARPDIAWEIELPSGALVACVEITPTATDRQCVVGLTRTAPLTLRVRGRSPSCDPDGEGPNPPTVPCVGAWSVPFTVPAGLSPGPFTITFTRPGTAAPPPPPPTGMATRFYLPSTGTPSISPAFGSGWEVTTNADRRTMVTTRIASAMTNKDGVGDAAVTDQLLRQYISSALAAQTLSGTVKGVMRMASNTANIGMGAPAFRVAKCNSDGSVVTEIIAVTASPEAASAAPPATEGTTLENRRLETSPTNTFTITVPSTTINDGDFLIVELGYKDNTTDTGRFVRINFGDDSASDLPEDETTTTADNPWVEFSADISFAAGGGAVSVIRGWAQYRRIH